MPEFGEAETARMIAAVQAARPDVLFVCLGTPKQEEMESRGEPTTVPPGTRQHWCRRRTRHDRGHYR